MKKRSVYIQTDHLPKIEGLSVATAFWVLDNMRCVTHWGVFLMHCQYLRLGRRFQPPPRLPSDISDEVLSWFSHLLVRGRIFEAKSEHSLGN